MSRVQQISVIVAVAMLVASGPLAYGSLNITSVVGGGPMGVNYVNFNALPLGSAGGFAPNTANSAETLPTDGITVNLVTNAQIVTGSVSGQYAAPYLSNNNGAPFGDTVANGPTDTQYITSGSTGSTAGAMAELVFPAPQMYMGILWGSVDLYNTLTFYSGLNPVGVLTGADVNIAANGDQGANGTYYVNINSTLSFDRVVATSSQFAFEFDNVAYFNRPIVPEASTIAIWTLLSLIGLVAYRKHTGATKK